MLFNFFLYSLVGCYPSHEIKVNGNSEHLVSQYQQISNCKKTGVLSPYQNIQSILNAIVKYCAIL